MDQAVVLTELAGVERTLVPDLVHRSRNSLLDRLGVTIYQGWTFEKYVRVRIEMMSVSGRTCLV